MLDRIARYSSHAASVYHNQAPRKDMGKRAVHGGLSILRTKIATFIDNLNSTGSTFNNPNIYASDAGFPIQSHRRNPPFVFTQRLNTCGFLIADVSNGGK